MSKNTGWSDEYERGYDDALYRLFTIFEKEFYESSSDPYYAYYAKHVLDTIRKEIDPSIDE